MTGIDIYSPETVKHERTGATRTMSESTKGSTVSEDTLYAILNRLAVNYSAQKWILCPGEFDGRGHSVYYIVDVEVISQRYGHGIINVNGSVHKTHKHRLRDEIRTQRLEKLGYWVEDIENKDVKQANVEAILARHVRKDGGIIA